MSQSVRILAALVSLFVLGPSSGFRAHPELQPDCHRAIEAGETVRLGDYSYRALATLHPG